MDAAHERVREESARIVAEHKARKPDPHANDYPAWRTMGLACILVVKHRDTAGAYEISRDGGTLPHIYLPKSKTIALPESDGEFLLAVFPRSFVKWLMTKDAEAGRRFRELLGVTFPLSPTRPWTTEQCETWTHLDNRRMSINTRIQNGGRKAYVKLPFGWTA